MLTVTADRRIAFRPGRPANRRWTEADQHAALFLAGQSIRMPTGQHLRPSAEALQYRASGLTGSAS
jgi:hypothetical protein